MRTHDKRPPVTAAARMAVLACMLATLAVAWVMPLWVGGTPADAAVPATSGDPPLRSLVITQPLPGYTVAPSGPTNGPLTPTEFASQSSAPHQAEEQFNALATQPGFGAFIRLWTDRSGPGRGANDMAVLLFRIPKRGGAATFAAELRSPFAGAAGTDPFDVPSIPGAQGYSIQIAAPVPATEQIVVFRFGHYVSLIELASSASASNPAALGPSQAISMSFQQYEALHRPVGSAVPSRGMSVGTVVALVAAVLAVCAGALLVLARLRRRGPARSTLDPWGPGGIFDAFGATTPAGSDRQDAIPGVPELDRDTTPASRMVPALVSVPSSGSGDADDDPWPGPEWTGADRTRAGPQGAEQD